MTEPRWNTTSTTASSGMTPETAASALYSPTEWPASTEPSTKAPASRSSAICAAPSTAMATWVNWVRNSTPSG